MAKIQPFSIRISCFCFALVLSITATAQGDGSANIVNPDPFTINKSQGITAAETKIRQQQNLAVALKKQADPAPATARSVPFVAQQGLSGEQRYIVRFAEAPVSQYRGGVQGMAATSILANSANSKLNRSGSAVLNAKSPASQAYTQFLKTRQSDHLLVIQRNLGRSLVPRQSYVYALNGVATTMSQAEAAKVAALPNVVSVERDQAFAVDTANTPGFIGAHAVWAGLGADLPGVQGEGMLVGIIDTGINHTSPAFAEVGDDGYVHQNPLGEGVFLGECLDFPGLCNNKLVGSYTFLDSRDGIDPVTPAGDPMSKDTDGHGSHVASIAAGNIVESATIYDFLGVDQGISLGTISGIAPHANIIAYKVCAPSCSTSDIVGAVDQAILDGVDALNHSIGSANQSPWADSKSLAFLNARAAGIMVQNSAGNTGGAGTATTSGNAPWVTSVAWSSHDRDFTDKFLTDFVGGDTEAPTLIAGKSLSGAYTGPIVYAANFDNGDPTPGQCLLPFPAGTFSDQIVVCDRGAIARVQKCENVAAGGAMGCVLANVEGGAVSIDPDTMVIPAIHISAEDGAALKAWLASGDEHMATITESSAAFNNPEVADIMSFSSSAGPFNSFDFLAPSVAAPGVNVFAAGADLQFTHPGFATADPDDDPSVAGRYGVIGGSSMASPHMTGAAVLLKQLHPDWTAAEILSAFMTTGKTAMLKADGVSPADVFDFGGGRVQVDVAAQAGLLLDETAANFLQADPSEGGEPSELNVAAVVQDQCVFECSWSRTVTATVDGTWSVSTTGPANITVTPSTFALAAGASQQLAIKATTIGISEGEFALGQIILTPQDNSIPSSALSYAIQPTSTTNANVFTKAVDKLEAGNGELLTYTLTVNNVGGDEVFSVTDRVPENTIFVQDSANATVTDGETTTAIAETDGMVIWSGQLNPATGELVEALSPFGFIPMADLGVTPLGCPANCDDGAWQIDGVSISYFGQVYDMLTISVNGVVELGSASGTAASPTGVALPSVGAQNNLLAPFWTDLNLEDGGEFYSVALSTDDGTTYEVMSWEAIPLFGSGGLLTYNFQIWAQQGTENIWFVYGELSPVPATNLSVGFENNTGTVGATYYFNGSGNEPVSGTELQAISQAGGSATLEFQVAVNGQVGDTVLNIATMEAASTLESAMAFTVINNTGTMDSDGDGVADDQDNCRFVANAIQCDSDADGYGNHCDADFDNNGFVNTRDIRLIQFNLNRPSRPPRYSEYDMDCSGGRVSFADLQAARALLGTQPGPGAVMASTLKKPWLE